MVCTVQFGPGDGTIFVRLASRAVCGREEIDATAGVFALARVTLKSYEWNELQMS